MIKRTLANIRMRYTIVKNAFINEYERYKKELVTSPVDADKILLIQMETFDWDLADIFLRQYLRRCRWYNVFTWIKYRKHSSLSCEFGSDRNSRLMKEFDGLK